jgi:hypothetical protein
MRESDMRVLVTHLKASFLMDGGDVEKRTDYMVWTDWLNGALQEKRQQRTGSAGREFSSFIFHSSI